MRRLLLALTALLALTPPAQASWVWPVKGEVITQYRNGSDPYAGGQHRGIDIAAPVGTPVVAAAGGEVRFAGTAGSSGLTVSVRTGDGYDSSYLHLSALAVRAGAHVSAGERLGAVGTSGTRSAVQPHLHFGVREAGTRHAYLDPLVLLPPATAPPPSEAPKPAPAPAPAPLAPRPAPAPTGAPRPAPAPGRAPRPAPAPKGAPRPVPAPRGAPRPVPAPGRVPRRLPAPAPRLAPAPKGALRPGPAPTGAPRLAPGPSTAPAPGHAPRSRPAPTGAPRPLPTSHAGPLHELPPRDAPSPLPSRARPAQSSGPDIGWALACAGLLLAAGLLGLTDSGRNARTRGASACQRGGGGFRQLVRLGRTK